MWVSDARCSPRRAPLLVMGKFIKGFVLEREYPCHDPVAAYQKLENVIMEEQGSCSVWNLLVEKMNRMMRHILENERLRRKAQLLNQENQVLISQLKQKLAKSCAGQTANSKPCPATMLDLNSHPSATAEPSN
ncbi:hypothetical protein M5K25_000800 [Dendrobium thyrsiflorum]|uniref:Uncharacterized protein n=1 Tax=Dendrobium thyrsiflorum TaxID=117978 RepID=A0ABD0W9E0_DENTH